MKRRRRWVRILAVIVVGICSVVLLAGFYLTRGLSAGNKLIIAPLSLNTVADGEYTGRHTAGRWTCEVLVVVKDHQIVALDLLQDVTIPMEGLHEYVFEQVMAHQDTSIDVKAQATVTSKAYLKAIEQALQEKGTK